MRAMCANFVTCVVLTCVRNGSFHPPLCGQTVGERVFATSFEMWDANADTMKTVGHFKAQCHDGKDVVVHVVSLRDKFFPMALMRDVS